MDGEGPGGRGGVGGCIVEVPGSALAYKKYDWGQQKQQQQQQQLQQTEAELKRTRDAQRQQKQIEELQRELTKVKETPAAPQIQQHQ